MNQSSAAAHAALAYQEAGAPSFAQARTAASVAARVVVTSNYSPEARAAFSRAKQVEGEAYFAEHGALRLAANYGILSWRLGNCC